jgi:methionine sulfoxide reductase heme-binding subunit
MAGFSLNLQKRWHGTSVWALYVTGLMPAASAFYLGATGQLGADPVKTFELMLGLWAIRFLLATLAISPLRELFGWNLMRYRRAFGLLCFYYALMHFAVYMILDQALVLKAVGTDVLKRPFIMFGMAGLAMLLALALTSNQYSIRRLGGNWIRLHRLVYIIAACGAVHFALSTKVLSLEQYVYIGVIILMILYRAWRPIMAQRRRAAKQAVAAVSRAA